MGALGGRPWEGEGLPLGGGHFGRATGRAYWEGACYLGRPKMRGRREGVWQAEVALVACALHRLSSCPYLLLPCYAFPLHLPWAFTACLLSTLQGLFKGFMLACWSIAQGRPGCFHLEDYRG